MTCGLRASYIQSFPAQYVIILTPLLAGVRQELFKHSFPTQLRGQQSLCQVSELALCGSIQDLIERTDQHSNVRSTEYTPPKTVVFGGNGLRAALGTHCLRQFNCLSQTFRTRKTKKQTYPRILN